MDFVWGTSFYLAYAYGFWLLFVSVITIKSKWSELKPAAKILAAPAGVAAVLIDVAFNVISSVPFFEPPQEWFFTQRISRHKPDSNWRGAMSRWICATLLDPFEQGGHCR